jgi:hypothetical protein
MRKHMLAAAILLTGCTAGQPVSLDSMSGAGPENRSPAIVPAMATSLAASPKRVATLRHYPRLILEAMAQKMGIRLRPEIALPAILLESRTPLQRMQAAAKPQWGFRPQAFANAYATAENRIYLIDSADFYERHERTLDDALAHEFVHYLQAKYLRDGFDSEWSEATAIAMQNWFRKTHMAPTLAAATAGPRAPTD